MLRILVAALVAAGSWSGPACADLTAELRQSAGDFGAKVRELDPRAEDSEPLYRALVESYVPSAGPVQQYLDFMTASGFTCPSISSLAYEPGSDVLLFRCSFAPDLGESGEPSLSSVTEETVFSVIARSDAQHVVMGIEGSMIHGLTGP
jgi:hypothetical protein